MSALTDRIAQEIWQAYVVETGRSLPEGLADKMAAAVAAELQLTEEWSVQGECAEGDDCDHFGEHGKWSCSAIADSREEASAFAVAKTRGAEVVRRWVSAWSEVQP